VSKIPDTLHGTVWGAPELAPQYPRRTGTKFILALMIPPLIAVATYNDDDDVYLE
jgi:hypothetical protein